MPTIQCGTLEVVPAFSESNVEVQCNLTDAVIVAGEESANVNISATNDNDRAAEVTYSLFVGNTEVNSNTYPSVGSGETRNEIVQVTSDDPGTYTIEIEWSAVPTNPV